MELSIGNLNELQTKSISAQLKKCNEISEKFGLSLSKEDLELVLQERKEVLISTGRIEFGGGIVEKLVYTFCDSPYMNQEEYVELLIELQELFYLFKRETREQLTDDELISAMRLVFDYSGGSLDFLMGMDRGTLYKIACAGSLEGII
ncbi:MAG: DUF6323 family protein [Lachnospiraceae bacterium]|nr:hypothetical protein [Lachnospiraceae bacterium]MEE1341539.1 DUF6323 family protein [Lachnospiraceae bacterium]